MTIREKNLWFSRGWNCPICGMQLMDLAHDGYECGDENYHDFYCTRCNIDFTIVVDENGNGQDAS